MKNTFTKHNIRYKLYMYIYIIFTIIIQNENVVDKYSSFQTYCKNDTHMNVTYFDDIQTTDPSIHRYGAQM